MRQVTLATILLGFGLAAYGTDTRAAPLPPIEPEQAGFSVQGLKRIDDFFDREIKQNRVPGAVVAIARGGGLVYLKAFGHVDKDKDLPMRGDSIFALASMTKPMTAVGVLSLTEQGRLPLFTRLTDYFPEFGSMKVAVPAADGSIQYEPQKRPIYIQDLLRHTSGLTYGGRPDTAGAVANLYPAGAEPPPTCPEYRAIGE